MSKNRLLALLMAWLLPALASAQAVNFEQISGVGISTCTNAPTNGQVLTYSAAVACWINSAGSSGGITSITSTGATIGITGSSTVNLEVVLVPASALPAFTGDVTTSAGSSATTIATGAVTLAKMANLAANSILGNNTGSPATPIALTTTQAKSLLAIANTDVSGLGTFATANAATPPAIGGTTPAAGAFTTLNASGQTQSTGLILGNATGTTFSATAAAPLYFWDATGQGTDLKNWSAGVSGATWQVRAHNDAVSSADVGLAITRGTTFHISTIVLGNTADAPSITADGPLYSVGTGAPAVSGCGTAGTIVGNATTFTFVVGTGAATCTFVATPTGLTATHGWITNVDDVTAKIHCPNNGTIASTTTGTALCNSTVTTGDLITVHLDPF